MTINFVPQVNEAQQLDLPSNLPLPDVADINWNGIIYPLLYLKASFALFPYSKLSCLHFLCAKILDSLHNCQILLQLHTKEKIKVFSHSQVCLTLSKFHYPKPHSHRHFDLKALRQIFKCVLWNSVDMFLLN